MKWQLKAVVINLFAKNFNLTIHYKQNKVVQRLQTLLKQTSVFGFWHNK